jgi:hypothetical protein
MMKTTSLTSIVMGGRREEGLGWRVMGRRKEEGLVWRALNKNKR